MEINVLEESKNKLVFEIPGEDHTLCNALKRELWKDNKVKAASYAIKHPSIGIPQMIVETSGTAPRDALASAAKRLQKQCVDFKKMAEKSLK